jgi:hypothetical protein
MKHHLIEYYDDERNLGNGIIVTLIPGVFFYDDCGVMGFDSPAEAKRELGRVVSLLAARKEV